MRRVWTPEQEAILRARYPAEPTVALAQELGHPVRSVYCKAKNLGIKKTAEYLLTEHACRLRRGGDVGAATRFKKGMAPVNKGTKRPGWAPGRMAETQFKSGKLSGRAAQLLLPVGTEVVDRDGYRKRKVRKDAAPNMSRFNWKFVHVLVWEEKHGPVPKGHAVVFRNRDKADIRADNLELVTRAELMRRNSFHNNYPKEIGRVIQLRGAIVRQINKRLSHEKQD